MSTATHPKAERVHPVLVKKVTISCMYKNKSLRLAFTQTHNGKHLFQTALPKMVIQASLKYQNVPEFVVETDLNC